MLAWTDAMVNGKWSCIFIALFQSTDHSKRLTIHATFTHSYTDGGNCHARRQLLIRSNLGFGILLKDTSTCSCRDSAGTFRLLDDPLYQLSYSHPKNNTRIKDIRVGEGTLLFFPGVVTCNWCSMSCIEVHLVSGDN